jgi:hypothetical protein
VRSKCNGARFSWWQHFNGARQLLGIGLSKKVSNARVKYRHNYALRTLMQLAVKHGPPLALSKVLGCVQRTPGRFNFIASTCHDILKIR